MGHSPGGDEDAGPEHPGDAEGGEVVPAELPLHVRARSEPDLVQLLLGSPCGEHSLPESVRCLGEGLEVMCEGEGAAEAGSNVSSSRSSHFFREMISRVRVNAEGFCTYIIHNTQLVVVADFVLHLKGFFFSFWTAAVSFSFPWLFFLFNHSRELIKNRIDSE